MSRYCHSKTELIDEMDDTLRSFQGREMKEYAVSTKCLGWPRSPDYFSTLKISLSIVRLINNFILERNSLSKRVKRRITSIKNNRADEGEAIQIKESNEGVVVNGEDTI